MFFFNNIHDRPYDEIYTTHSNQSKVIFDLSVDQINNAKNKDWSAIEVGDLCCVINSCRKFSNIYVVREKGHSGIAEDYIIRGDLVAKVVGDPEFTSLFNRHKVTHKRLPKNMLSKGFNVANLEEQLNGLSVKINTKMNELKNESKNELFVRELEEIFYRVAEGV